MAIQYGDDKDLVIKPILQVLTTNAFPPILPVNPTIIEFQDDPLSGLQKTIAYGDLRNITMEAKAISNLTTPGAYTNSINDYTINFGWDNLSFGDKNNDLFGDMQDLTLHAVGGGSSGGVVTMAYVIRNTFNYGEDTISAGNGNNTVYGDARDVVLKSEKGTNFDGSAVPSPNTEGQLGADEQVVGNFFAFGIDTITLGSGNNIVYGDIQDISMISLGGKALTNGAVLQVSDVSLNSFEYAGDFITVGNGQNMIYGDFREWLMLTDGGKTFGTPSADKLFLPTLGAMEDNAVLTGGDHIFLGDGNNTVFGDGQSLEIKAVSGMGNGGDGPLGSIVFTVFTFGDDHILPDTGKTAAGHNLVYGDIMDFTIEVHGEHALQLDVAPFAQIHRNDFIFGDDEITLGNGGNTIYGDTHDVTYHAFAGDNSLAFILAINVAMSIRANALTYGDDTITSGSGADYIYADAHNLALIAEGEQATTANSGAVIGVRVGVANTFNFGQDTVHAGGGADLIVGDAWDVSLVGKGGLVTNPDLVSFGRVTGVRINPTSGAGNDHLYGEGGNDTIYGDFYSLTLQAIGGKVAGTGGSATGQVTNNVITFGSDTIDGGSGDDFLSGDLVKLTLSAVNGTDTSGVGNVQGILSGNVINWGDDLLTGGTGADKFAFTLVDLDGDGLLEMQGHDTITDFNEGAGDRMQFTGVASLDALNDSADFDNSQNVNAQNGNDTVITFDNGTSITLYDITIMAFSAANTTVVA